MHATNLIQRRKWQKNEWCCWWMSESEIAWVRENESDQKRVNASENMRMTMGNCYFFLYWYSMTAMQSQWKYSDTEKKSNRTRIARQEIKNMCMSEQSEIKRMKGSGRRVFIETIHCWHWHRKNGYKKNPTARNAFHSTLWIVTWNTINSLFTVCMNVNVFPVRWLSRWRILRLKGGKREIKRERQGGKESGKHWFYSTKR